ncbi:MAG: hypothetical protein ACI4IS_02930 [Acutalibacteraceae bacterium]
METIISSVITAAVAIIVCLINNSYQNKSTRTLLEYKLSELTKRVDKHNSVIERTYNLEQQQSLHSEKIKVINHRIDELLNK